jgi:hypothetical protein
LLLLIGLGGTAVLGSYVLALVYEPEIRGALWGGIPEGALRTFYTINMLLAAASFFPATAALGFATPIDAFRERIGFDFEALLAAYAAILIPSAAWLPLTAFYIQRPSDALWWTIRIDLFAVGAGATMLGWMLIRRARGGPRWISVAATLFFFFWLQTMVLDALVWPAFFPR